MVAFLRSKILIEELQRPNTVDVIEILVEVVVFAQPVIDKSWQLTQLVDIDYRIDVVKKRRVRIHGTQRRRKQDKEDAAALGRPENADLTRHKNGSLLNWIEARVEDHYV